MQRNCSNFDREANTQFFIALAKKAIREKDNQQLHHAFSNLFSLYNQPLTRYIQNYMYLNELQKEEVVSETFCHAFKAISRYQPLQNVKFVSWLFKIARNIIYDLLSTSTREIPRDQYVYLDDRISTGHGKARQTYADVIPSAISTPESQVLSQEVYHFYRKALLELPPIDLLIMSWRTSDRLTHREIANRLTDFQGIPFSENTVRQRFHRSNVELREKMNEYARLTNSPENEIFVRKPAKYRTR